MKSATTMADRTREAREGLQATFVYIDPLGVCRALRLAAAGHIQYEAPSSKRAHQMSKEPETNRHC